MDPDQPNEQPDLVAQLDQLKAAATDIAELVWDYYKALTVAGFMPEQAFALAIDFQQSIFR